jgi:Uma2 family endonuclease
MAMTSVLGKSQFTPEDLLRMPGDERFELVNGQLVERDMGFESGWVASLLAGLLSAHAVKHQVGGVSTEATYQCFADDPDRVRRPDISFIQKSRLRPEMLVGHVRVAPDLAIEVVSPNDLFYDVRQKVGEYLNAGVRLVWILNPDKGEVDVYRVDGTYQLLKNGDSLDGEDVVPGFVVPLAEIFQPPPMDVGK